MEEAAFEPALRKQGGFLQVDTAVLYSILLGVKH